MFNLSTVLKLHKAEYRNLQVTDPDKDLTPEQVKSYLVQHEAKFAEVMKPRGIADHLKFKYNGQWYEVEPFYKYDENRFIVEFTLKVNGIDGTVLPAWLRGQFTIQEWNNVWAMHFGQRGALKARPTKYIKRIAKPGGGYTYFYKEEKAPTQSKTIWDLLSDFFKIPATQAKNVPGLTYVQLKIKEQLGVSLQDWSTHFVEYFKNKSKWDERFAAKEKKEVSPKGKPTGVGVAKKGATPKESKEQWNTVVMQFLNNLYGSKEKAVQKEVKPKEEVKEVKKPTPAKVEIVTQLTPEQKKESKLNEAIAQREGYFNEKPAEILNVGKDVWGAARHNYDTYEKFNVDVNQMENEGTAVAYVTKKNLIGDFGLANKDDRVSKGETEHKVLLSYAIRAYLAKMPADSEESRQKYMEFTRSVVRLDNETTNAFDYARGLGEIYDRLFPKEQFAKSTEVIGDTLPYFLSAMLGEKQSTYRLDKRIQRQIVNISQIVMEERQPVRTYDELVVMLLGATKAAGIKVKKGDSILFKDNLKNEVYITQTSFITKEHEEKHRQARLDRMQLSRDFITRNKESLEKYFKQKFSSMDEIKDVYKQERARLMQIMEDNLTLTRIYPSDKGQVVKAGKAYLSIAFPFADGNIRVMRIDPRDIKPENIEAVKRDAKTKTTARLDLFLESQVTREGGQDYTDISTTDAQKILTDDFKFKAVQYGNSMPDSERQYHTQWTVQAMSDLSEILDIPIDQITARGKLGIAFGARGKGGFGPSAGALAHYELTSKMINLTRANGYGSLAHEWMHFVDNVLSDNFQTMVSEVSTYAKKKVTSKEEIKHGSIYNYKRGKKTTRLYFDKNAKDPRYPFAQLKKGQNKPDTQSSYMGFYSYRMEVQEPIDIPYINLAQEIAQKSIESLKSQTNEEIEKSIPEKAVLLKDLILNNPYLNQNSEAFARAFETYISDKLAEKKRKNTYLASAAKGMEKDGKLIYPQGEARKEINKLFDQFFAELKKKNLLQKAIRKLQLTPLLKTAKELRKAPTFSGYPLHGRTTFQGLNISIENKKGTKRHWKSPQGVKGSTEMCCDYGYIRGTEGRDKDHIDVYLGPDQNSPHVFVIHQNYPDTGKYDEDKVMLGFTSASQAKQMYLRHVNKLAFFGGMKHMMIDAFKERVHKTLHSSRKSLKASVT